MFVLNMEIMLQSRFICVHHRDKFFIIIFIIIIIIIIIINIYSGSVYKYNGSFPYKLKRNINKRIKTVKITYKSIHGKYMGSLNTSISYW